jgi:uncharacterized protein DUF3761
MRKLWMAALVLAAAMPVSTVVTPVSSAEAYQSCRQGHYRNSRGNCVRRPVRANRPPAGATARCRDGTYSFSQSRRGTCSYHGGVARWLY